MELTHGTTMQLTLIGVYAAGLVALGLWIGRRVQTVDGFFVAGRGLGPGLLFSTLIAANIGAGSTVGAAGLGYRDGLAAWWWVGAAAAGSFVLAFVIGPRIRRVAARHGLHTVGDYLELRFGARVRITVGVLLWIGTLAILAGQLIAMSTLFTALLGSPKWLGCVIGGLVVVVYFTAGGLLSSAWVNMLQLVVLLLGFAFAVPYALAGAGGWTAVRGMEGVGEGYWNLMGNGGSGWWYLALLGPAFIVSPGLLQKIFGARDDRAVRIGTAVNGLVLLVFAFVPPLLGIIARALNPGLSSYQLALPTLLASHVPTWVGGLGLAALFSAEVSTADAILFMLSTSVSQDLYKRSVRPEASDADVLRVARWAAVVGGVLGLLLALLANTIVDALTFFYSVLGVCLFVPVVGGLLSRRVNAASAMAAIVGGMMTMTAVRVGAGAGGILGFTPAMAGLSVSIVIAVLVLFGQVGEPARSVDS